MSTHADRELEHFPRLSGRMTRGSYWTYLLGSFFGCGLWVAIAEKLRLSGWVIAFFVCVFAYGVFWAIFRRAHDLGWWGIAGLVPPMPLLLLFIPGNEGENAYGPQPTNDAIPTVVPVDQPLPKEINNPEGPPR
jgi:uncharacterized membrane protein YhaH (DUF805 family)